MGSSEENYGRASRTTAARRTPPSAAILKLALCPPELAQMFLSKFNTKFGCRVLIHTMSWPPALVESKLVTTATVLCLPLGRQISSWTTHLSVLREETSVYHWQQRKRESHLHALMDQICSNTSIQRLLEMPFTSHQMSSHGISVADSSDALIAMNTNKWTVSITCFSS